MFLDFNHKGLTLEPILWNPRGLLSLNSRLSFRQIKLESLACRIHGNAGAPRHG